MGLAEKRGSTEFQEKVYPTWKEKVEAAAGFPLEMEIRWDTMCVADQAVNYPIWWPKIYFEPLTKALTEITKDSMGKEALRTGLKKVIIDGSDGISPNSFKFVDGILSLVHKANTNLNDVGDRTKKIVELIEKAL